MLEGLERVDWAHLQHAYGSATDVPGLLRALTIVDALALVHLAYRQADLSPRAWLEAVAQANPSLAGAFGLSTAPRLAPSDGAGGGALPADAIRVLADVCPRAEALAAPFEIYPWFAAACSYSEAAMAQQAPALSETFSPLAEEWFEYVHAYLVGTLNILEWRPPD